MLKIRCLRLAVCFSAVCYSALLITVIIFSWDDESNNAHRVLDLGVENVTLSKQQPELKGEAHYKLERWQPATADGNVFVYSAFYENNFRDRIRMIGTILVASKAKLFCVYWTNTSATSAYKFTKAYVVKITEGHFKRFTAAYFICGELGSVIPSMVSLTDYDNFKRPLNAVLVRYKTADAETFNLSACSSPMYSQRRTTNNLDYLLEWIEMNRILGVQFFTFYNHNLTQRELDILEYYRREGIAEIMTWMDEPTGMSNILKQNGIHYNGQLAALNDCLYRHKGRSRHIMMIDVDELIIPHMAEDYTLNDVLSRLPEMSVYIFRHSFVKMKCLNCKGLCFVNSYERTSEINSEYDRSKLIVKPKQVVTVGIHRPWAIVASEMEHIVDTNIGFLHHYRTRPIRNQAPYNVIDNTTVKYQHRIIQRLLSTNFSSKFVRIS